MKSRKELKLMKRVELMKLDRKNFMCFIPFMIFMIVRQEAGVAVPSRKAPTAPLPLRPAPRSRGNRSSRDGGVDRGGGPGVRWSRTLKGLPARFECPAALGRDIADDI
jgi:hypothetical protein